MAVGAAANLPAATRKEAQAGAEKSQERFVNALRDLFVGAAVDSFPASDTIPRCRTLSLTCPPRV